MNSRETLLGAFKYAVAGIIYCVKRERNIKIHFFVAAIALILGVYLDFSRLELSVLLLVISGVLIAEFFNTVAELIVDLVSPSFHPLAKAAKDVAAGAVLVAALMAVFVGILLFWSKLVMLLGG